ncbi:hypothetical protein [Staphylococcus sp. HMSC14C01]|uniref:hypothetical protein n=1 Tax=Staphylococcus sp. HMSC14C01 TaxID=1581099 RepID=UPI0008A221C0|nr:hypothetical protein [Staphylococcus sp. HMSC14C01]OFV21547.1 hypothetical protein HMPREF3131_08595 [Staphylococcus sp. HMSC14C01]
MVKIKKRVALEPKEFLIHLLKKEETEVELDGYTFNYNEEHYSFDPEIKANEVISYDPYSSTFTVEVEEEITEDTQIYRLLELKDSFIFKDGGWKDLNIMKSNMYGNQSISEVKNDESKKFYMLNEDDTMTLIWKDGELVGDE